MAIELVVDIAGIRPHVSLKSEVLLVNRGRVENYPKARLNDGFTVVRACLARAITTIWLHTTIALDHRRSPNKRSLHLTVVRPSGVMIAKT